MMSNSKSPIEKLVERQFSEIDAKRGEWCELPITGARIVRGDAPIAPQKKTAVAALGAQDCFAVNGPADAAPLPLTYRDIERYRNARGLMGLVGFYARSLARQGWDVRKHPSFEDFARGLMAIDTGMWGIENDEDLKRRFPPRRLAGMTPGAYWAPPKEYAETMENYRRAELREARFTRSANSTSPVRDV